MLTPTQWHGFDALQLENNHIRTLVVPALGGKIVSMFDKRAGHEWLAAPTNPPRQRTYGDTFTDYELSGWDEMFPTINACPYPPDESIALPDHGEVWLLPWDVTGADNTHIALSINGQALPYRLSRTLTLSNDGIQLDYALHNLSDKALIYLWAAHPLFAADPQTRLHLPDSVTQVMNVIADDPALGAEGTHHPFPTAVGKDGVPQHLDQVKAPDSRTCRKYYILPDASIGWAQLEQLDKSCVLRMQWDAAVLPYCGVWVDEGIYTTQSTIAPEPSNGFYDSLTLAKEQARYGQLAAGHQTDWRLNIQLHMTG